MKTARSPETPEEKRTARVPLTGSTRRLLLPLFWLLVLVPRASGSQAGAPARQDPARIFASGQAALAKGALDEAEADFRKVLRLDPRSAAAHANLAVVAM